MKISGVDKLNKKIAALPAAVRQDLRAALEASAAEIVDTAKSFAPVKTGDLRESIGFTFGQYTPAANVRGVSTGRGGHDLAVTIHAGDERAFYAAFVEFGTAPHSIAKGGGTKAGQRKARHAGKQFQGAAANPFFYPAYRLGKKRAKSRISRATTKAAKRVAAS